jgi:hypothetical protein
MLEQLVSIRFGINLQVLKIKQNKTQRKKESQIKQFLEDAKIYAYSNSIVSYFNFGCI